MDMQGKTVIVTGAGSGVGLETADALVRMGVSLILIELNRERGEAAVKRIAQNGAKPRLFLADLSLQAESLRLSGLE
jgi:NAD(P)-dependent dehydrogenase (short-subunit alcohol dehydrogenase family)